MTNRPSRAAVERALADLARNYRWTWDPPTRDALDRVRTISGAPQGHPLLIAPCLDDAHWAAIAADPDLIDAIFDAHRSLEQALAANAGPRTVAYFSPEFGISETLPQYSGGLGVLAGDHLKAASDLSLPLVGVGLFYREGFFRQLVDGGRQHEWYQLQDPLESGLADTGLRIPIEFGDHTAWARVWRADIGSIPLFLLDTNLPENSARDRTTTDRLYAGDQEHRLRQELVLGVGGARALTALGIVPQRYHLNEGHAGLLILELLGGYLEQGLPFDKAVSSVKPLSHFTTHTPVPAGIDRFPRELFGRYVAEWCDRYGVAFDDLFALGVLPDDNDARTFNMAAFCLNMSGTSNAVSKLHQTVSRQMFSRLAAGRSIGAVTNGVHARTWVSPSLQRIFDRALGPGWCDGDAASWARAGDIGDDELRETFAEGRRQLVDMVLARGTDGSKLDPNVLTIGFARRFATYKRASLLLHEVDRLVTLLGNNDYPVQFVFAGKAHPADEPGKAVLAQISEFAEHAASNGRFVFVPDYDIEVARTMYHGCDVWLNNPVRPQEACGTSGMKAALNGALNCSVRDGWWDECSDGTNGWDIPTSDDPDPAGRDLAESASLMTILESAIVPFFYKDVAPSAQWLQMVRHAWHVMGGRLTAARMVSEYRDRYYG